MKKSNNLGLKIYVFIILFSITSGWFANHEDEIFINDSVGRIRISMTTRNFNYFVFFLFLTIGFTITLIYDFYIYRKNNIEKLSKKNQVH
jgi:hypothetical protein